MKKQLLSGLLAGAMVMSLAACGSSASSSTASSAADTTSTEAASTSNSDLIYGYTCMRPSILHIN